MKEEIFSSWSANIPEICNVSLTLYCCRIVSSPEGVFAVAKYDEMMELLRSLEEEIFSSWSANIPEICNVSLAKTLFIIDPETRLLALNFDKEVGFWN